MKKTWKKILATAVSAAMVCGVFAGCAKKEDKTVKMINISLTDEEYAFGVDKNNAELLEKVNAYVKEVKGNGKLDTICNNYFGDGTPQAVVSAALDESKEQLVVVTNAEFAPFEYKEGSNYYGIDMELVAGLAEYVGQELVILDVDFDSVCTYVETGKADMVAAGLTVNETRKQSVTFSESYYLASQVLIVPNAETKFDDCKTTADVLAILEANACNIGGQSGTTAESYVKGDADWGFDGIKGATWKGYTSGSLAANDMIAGNIDYVIIDKAPAQVIVEKIAQANK